MNLLRSDVKMVMDRLGMFGSAYGPEGDQWKASGSIGVGEHGGNMDTRVGSK